MRKLLAVIALLSMAVCWSVALHAQNTDGNTIIRVRGTDSMAGRINGLSKLFMTNNPGMTITVSGGSRGTGFEGLLDKSCEVAMVDRKLTEQEKQLARAKGVDLVERLVGYGGIVIEVNPSNSISELSMEDVQKVLRGDIVNWKQVGGKDEPITILNVGEEHGGTVTFMQNDVLKGVFPTSATVLSGFSSVLRRVAETPGGIGYTRVRDAFESPVAEQVSFKVLKLKQNADSPAVMPSRTTMADGTYPLRRPFYLYTNAKAANEATRRLVDFLAEKGWGKQQVTP
jgi:phosphate transport system substrate-binding protein